MATFEEAAAALWGNLTWDNVSFLRDFGDYVSEIGWREPWLEALVASHVLLALLLVATRSRSRVQVAAFFCIMGAALCAQWVNGWARGHWESFAQRPYFDATGGFISLVYTGPLLVHAFIVIVNLLVISGGLLVKVKRAQRAQRLRKSQAADQKKSQ
eukprot:m51a1_g885 hypothetical protein (157) ;mRNA; f:892407-893100